VHQNHTISIHFAKVILKCISRDNDEIETLLLSVGINAALFNNPRNRITPLQFGQLIKGVAKQYKDEFFGLSEKPLPLGSFSLLARNAVHCNNLLEVYKSLELALKVMTTQLSLKLSIEQNQACVHIQVLSSNKEAKVILTELAMLIWHRFPSWLVGKEIPLEQVCLPYDKTAHSEEYPLMFSTNNISFKANTAKMYFPLKYLDLPCQRSSIELMDYIGKLPDYWFKRAEYARENNSVSNECLRLIELSSDTCMVSIAKQMNRSVRTLRRDLSAEKNSFNKLKAQHLRDKAIHLMTETNTSIENIAHILGYTEASAFSRVFKQWTGSSPRSYRQFFV
jgi:AraC-like DNA-binding protein